MVPGIIVFEFQATQSKRYRKLRPGQPVFRSSPLTYGNTELYDIDKKFLAKVFKLTPIGSSAPFVLQICSMHALHVWKISRS